MLSLRSILHDFFETQPVFRVYWEAGLINNKALAIKLKPIIEAMTLKKVSISSIQITLGRLSHSKSFTKKIKIEFEKVSFRPSMIYFRWFRSPELVRQVQDFKDQIVEQLEQDIIYIMDPKEIALVIPKQYYTSEFSNLESQLSFSSLDCSMVTLTTNKNFDWWHLQQVYSLAMAYNIDILASVQNSPTTYKAVFKANNPISLHKFQTNILNPKTWI